MVIAAHSRIATRLGGFPVDERPLCNVFFLDIISPILAAEAGPFLFLLPN